MFYIVYVPPVLLTDRGKILALLECQHQFELNA